MRQHGIELVGDRAYLRFAMLSLVLKLKSGGSDPQRPDSARWRAKGFRQAVDKFTDTYWKFDRVAAIAFGCQQRLQEDTPLRLTQKALSGEFKLTRRDPELVAYLNAMSDLQICMDALLFYLRIEVDAFAAMMRFFYPRPAEIRMDFRKQVRRFTDDKRLDPVYARIVSQQLDWFHKLSGETSPKGLRENVVHYFGTYQMAWKGTELTPKMVRTGHEILESDTLRSIQEITAGWMGFLDACVVHFVELLSAQGVSAVPAGSTPSLNRAGRRVAARTPGPNPQSSLDRGRTMTFTTLVVGCRNRATSESDPMRVVSPICRCLRKRGGLPCA